MGEMRNLPKMLQTQLLSNQVVSSEEPHGCGRVFDLGPQACSADGSSLRLERCCWEHRAAAPWDPLGHPDGVWFGDG